MDRQNLYLVTGVERAQNIVPMYGDLQLCNTNPDSQGPVTGGEYASLGCSKEAIPGHLWVKGVFTNALRSREGLIISYPVAWMRDQGGGCLF